MPRLSCAKYKGQFLEFMFCFIEPNFSGTNFSVLIILAVEYVFIPATLPSLQLLLTTNHLF